MSESAPLAEADRLRIFYDALAAVPAAASMEEAIAILIVDLDGNAAFAKAGVDGKVIGL